MDIGSGVAIVGTVASISFGVTSIVKGLGGRKCPMHDMVIEEVKGMKEWLIRVEGKIDEVIKEARK